MEAMILTIREACDYSRTSRSALYSAIKSGQLTARKRGARTLILMSDLRAWVEALPKVGNGAQR
jgi:excisionase family DNA binding protein